MTTNRFDQLKQIFNIDDEIEENDDLPTEDQIHEAMELADTLNDRLSVAQDQVSDNHDREMDEISELAMQGFKDLKELGMDVEVRHAGEIFSGAATMLKIGLDARNSKVDKKLRLMKLQLDKLRLDRSMPPEQPKEIDGNVNLVDRTELLKQIKAIKKENDAADSD